MKNSPPSKMARGFTLAEVMIAMGIVASVMVALLGMIPLGVRSVREATNMTLTGRIAQEVISNIQQANWKEVVGPTAKFDGQTFKFDNEGFIIRQGSKQIQTFEATVHIEPAKISIGKTTYAEDTLRKISVTVEFTPEGRKVKVGPNEKDKNKHKAFFTFYVANQNKSG